jgi:hypothetical protein
MLPTAAANADGKVTWASNAYVSRCLDVDRDTQVQGVPVGIWSCNRTTAQYWWDISLGFGHYYEEESYGSYAKGLNLALTAYNTCSQGVTLWHGVLYTTQEWKEDYVASGVWQLINYGGCDGDPYHDTLGLSFDSTIYRAYLYENTDAIGDYADWH